MTHNKKVFCVSAHKNATTSIGEAFRTMGLTVCPYEIGYKYIGNNEELALPITDEYDAFEDSPWCHEDFYKKLHEKHPDAYFILTVRPAEEWFNSYVRFIEKQYTYWEKFPYKELFIRLYGAPCIENNKPILINRYESRNNEICEYFLRHPEAKFLHLRTEELSYRTLCEFLQIEIVPKQIFPYLNYTLPTTDLKKN